MAGKAKPQRSLLCPCPLALSRVCRQAATHPWVCIFYPALSTNLQELEARSRNNEVSILLLLANAAATGRQSKFQTVNSHLHPLNAQGTQPDMIWESADPKVKPLSALPREGGSSRRWTSHLGSLSAHTSHSSRGHASLWKPELREPHFCCPFPQFLTVKRTIVF